MQKDFYKMLYKNKACFVAKEKNKILGDIGFFVQKDQKLGLIACIFIANEFKGRGLSKILYKQLLLEFKKQKLTHYLGATTTDKVLQSAKKMGRFEVRRAYFVKI